MPWSTGVADLTWLVLGVALTVVGLALSAVLWARRGPASGLRSAAWSLVPLAAALTGTLRLVGEVADAVARWATRLVFGPTVWLGLGVAGLSVALFAVSAAVRRRTPAGPAQDATALPRTASRRAVPRGRDTVGPGKAAGADGDDMADIEAILRRHGIE